jgi:hypothetical protein
MWEKFGNLKKNLALQIRLRNDSAINFIEFIIQLLKRFDLQQMNPEDFLSLGLTNKAVLMDAEIMRSNNETENKSHRKRIELLKWLSRKKSVRVKKFIAEILAQTGINKAYAEIANLRTELERNRE